MANSIGDPAGCERISRPEMEGARTQRQNKARAADTFWNPCPISVRGCLFSGKVHHCYTPTGHEPDTLFYARNRGYFFFIHVPL